MRKIVVLVAVAMCIAVGAWVMEQGTSGHVSFIGVAFAQDAGGGGDAGSPTPPAEPEPPAAPPETPPTPPAPAPEEKQAEPALELDAEVVAQLQALATLKKSLDGLDPEVIEQIYTLTKSKILEGIAAKVAELAAMKSAFDASKAHAEERATALHQKVEAETTKIVEEGEEAIRKANEALEKVEENFDTLERSTTVSDSAGTPWEWVKVGR